MTNEKKENTKQASNETIEKKGIFAKLWEGIRNVFSSLGNLFSKLSSHKQTQFTQNEIEEKQNTENNRPKTDEGKRKGVETSKEEIVPKAPSTITPEVEQYFNNLKHCHIVEKLGIIMKTEITDENRDFMKKVVEVAINNFAGNGDGWEKAIKNETDKHSQGMVYEDVKLFPEKILAFVDYAKDLLGKDVSIPKRTQDIIMQAYTDICKREFATLIKQDYSFIEPEHRPIDEKTLLTSIEFAWNKISSGQITTSEAYQVLTEETGLAEATKVQIERDATEYEKDAEADELLTEADELLADDNNFLTDYGEQQPKPANKEFDTILSDCPHLNDGIILNNIKTINELICAVDALNDMDDAEKTYVKNTLVEARKIVEKGEVALWNSDGAEPLEMKEAEDLFNGDETHISTTADENNTHEERND